MNNNRGNNRRRGRGNNNRQGGGGGGGGQQLNRIDSRARGNAPQMLEKYRKLAHDAHLNGDRVTEEYYLQFADHYFRVIADTRQRQEEQRQRRDDRGQEGGDSYREDGDDAGEFANDGDYSPYDTPSFTPRREREDRPREERQREDRPREDRQRDDRPREERAREDRPREDRPRDDRPREDRPRGEGRKPRVAEQAVADEAPAVEGSDGGETPYEPAENPFTRDNRTRGLKPRREDRRPRREAGDAEGAAADAPAFDTAILPPAIGTRDEPAADVSEPALAAADEAEAKPRRRTRKPKPPVDDAGEALESVG